MTMRSGFHNSINGDRKYNAQDMNMPYKELISNGVFPNPSNQLQVTASSGMTVSVGAGGGLFGGGWAFNDSAELITVDSAEATLSRIDAIVVRRDDSEDVRNTFITYKKGSPASSPVAPTITRTDTINEYCLATINIAPGTTVITQAMITDTRPNTNVCGWVTALIEQVDTSTLFIQWQSAYEEMYALYQNAYDEQFDTFMAEFSVWWEGVKNILADDKSASAEILRLRQEKADRKTSSATLSASSWTLTDGFYYQSINVSGLTANDVVFVSYDVETLDACMDAGLVCVEQTTGTLKFRSDSAEELKVNIVNIGSN